MKPLNERFLFKPTATTEINESNAQDLLPKTVFEYVQLAGGKTLLKVEGIIGDYVNPNGNGRIYEEQVWDHVLESKSHIIKDINEHNAWGVREHPASGETVLPEVSHRILSLRKDESMKKIIAEILIVDTAAGKDIRAMLESGGTVGMSTRGMGDTMMREGIDYVQVGFICETIDFVTVNSVQDARFNTHVNAEAKEIATENAVTESVSEDSSDKKPDEQVNSNNDDQVISESKKLTEKKMVNLQAKRLELASLQSIAKSEMDDSQVSAITESIAASKEEIKGAIKSGDLQESDVASLIEKYDALEETAKQNSPVARELAEAKAKIEVMTAKYETLKQLATGLHQRYDALQENYKGLKSGSKIAEGEGSGKKPAKTPAVISEADVKASKRYQTLLSLAEGLAVRAKRVTKMSESRKVKVQEAKKGLAIAESKLNALKSLDMSEKAKALLIKCESVEQVSKVVDRVKSINESAPKVTAPVAKPEKKEAPLVESQAHKEPLPGSDVSKVTESKKTSEIHDSLSVVQRMRKMK